MSCSPSCDSAGGDPRTLRLRPRAPIVLELESATRRAVSPAAVFVALRRLEQRGYARSSKREARPGEGGRGSREFQITAAGKAKLAESRRTFERLWGTGDPVAEPS